MHAPVQAGADAVVATLLPSLDNKGGRVIIAVLLLILSVGLSFVYERHGPDLLFLLGQ